MMQFETYSFHKDISDNQHSELVANLHLRREAAKISTSGETPMPQMYRTILTLGNYYLHQRREDFSLHQRESITSHQIHLIPQEIVTKRHKHVPHSDFSIFRAQEDIIDLSFSPDSPPQEVACNLLHELVEANLNRKMFFFPNPKDTRQTNMAPIRSGYRTYSKVDIADKKTTWFSGFTDALIQNEVSAMILMNTNLFENLNISPDRAIAHLDSCPYSTWQKLVNKILVTISQKTGQPLDLVLNSFARGLYSGDMTPLLQVDRVFGSKSLNVLGLLGSRQTDKYDRVVTSYFSELDPKKRSNMLTTGKIFNNSN